MPSRQITDHCVGTTQMSDFNITFDIRILSTATMHQYRFRSGPSGLLDRIDINTDFVVVLRDSSFKAPDETF